MIKDAYTLSFCNNVLNKLHEANYISQIPLQRASRPITAFTVPGLELYQFKVMPYKLHSAPATFQFNLDQIIGPYFINDTTVEPH